MDKRRKLTPDQVEKIREMLDQDMALDAIGLSRLTTEVRST